MTYYLVQDYTEVEKDDRGHLTSEPKCYVATDEPVPGGKPTVWDVLDRARASRLKVAIHAIGECLLDWS